MNFAKFIIIAGLFFSGAVFAQGAKPLALSLERCETQAIVNSPEIAASVAQYAAAVAVSSAVDAARKPVLNLEVNGYYQGTVIEINSMGRTISMGDNWNLAAGPALYYSVFDFGARKFAAQGAEAAAEARRFELDAAKRSVLLAVRTAYFNVMLAAEQNYIAGQYLALAGDQYQDTVKRAAAGDKTRVDVLQFRQDLYARRKRYLASGRELAASLAALYAITDPSADSPATPVDARLASLNFDEMPAPDALVSPDSFAPLYDHMAAAENKKVTDKNPNLQSVIYLSRGAKLEAERLRAQRWLDVQFYAKAQANYPKGPVLEMFNQNTLGVTASMPLWEDGKKQSLANQQEAFAAAYDRKTDAAARDLKKTFKNAADGLAYLRRQLKTDTAAQTEADELAGLMYKSYSAGSAKYLEVQAANVRALNAAGETALTRAQILIQLAVLDSIGD